MKERWKNFPNKGPLLALSCGHATVDSYAAFLAPLWPLLMVRFDLSLAAVGVLISVVGLSGAAVQPLYGFIADRSHRRTFLIWGPLLAAVFTCLIGWAPTRAAFVACLIMAHVGINAYHPQAAATVSRIGGARRGLAMGLFMNSGAVGFALGPLIAPWFVTRYGLEQMLYLIVPGVAMALLLARFSPRLPKPADDAAGRVHLIETLRRSGPILGVLFVIAALRASVNIGFTNFLPMLFHEKGMSLSHGGMLLAVFLLPGAIGGLIGGVMSDHVDRRKLLAYTMIASTPLFFWILSATGTGWLPVVLFFANFLFMSSLPANLVMAQEVALGNVSMASSLIMGIAWAAGTLMASGIAFLADRIGITGALQVLAFVPAVAGVLAFLFLRGHRVEAEQERGV
ncbi:MAG: MFS transporter [Candidatus Latescibacteria bacterium]|nr:MFS transporter [Candidatus Latescibacterota bacterium]